MISLIKNILSFPEPPEFEEPEPLREFFEEVLNGRKIPFYEDGRRVPLELFLNPLRVLLLSKDPKSREFVRSPDGFCSKDEILINKPGNREPGRNLLPARHKRWHEHPIAQKLYPKFTPDPIYKMEMDDGSIEDTPECINVFLKHCRAGRQPVFVSEKHLDPEIFDNPFIFHLFTGINGKRINRVRDRWRRPIRGVVMVPTTPYIDLLNEQLKSMKPHLMPDIQLHQ